MKIAQLESKSDLHVQAYRTIRLDALKINPESFAFDYDHEVEQGIEFFRAQMKQAHVFGSFADERLIGMGKVVPDTLPKRTHIGTIGSIFVYPEFRGQRIGRKLCERLIRHAEDLGLKQLELIVTSTQDSAIALYKVLDFQECGTHPRAICVNGNFFDAVFMSKFLQP